VISLPSTGPLIWLGCHVPRLYLTWCKLIPKAIYGASCPYWPPPSFPPPSLHLLLCLSPVVCLSSNWSHISSPVCRKESLSCCTFAPFSSFLPVSLSLSGSTLPPFFSTSILPQPRPVATAVLLQFMGSLQQLSKEKWSERWKGEMERDYWERGIGDEEKEGHMIKIY